MRLAVLVCLPLLLAALVAAAPPAAEPLVRFTPASAVAPALADVLTLPEESRPFIRYVSAYEAADAELPGIEQVLALILNSLSTSNILYRPVRVAKANGRLWRVDLTALHIHPEAYYRLAELGSGRTPLPEPYFHQIVEQIVEQKVANYYGGWEVKKKAVRTFAHASWLPQAEIIQLSGETHSGVPVVRWDWFAANALLEPRYHELLNLGEHLHDVFALADADPVLVDKLGEETKGVVTRSEVATNVRGLRRIPTRRRRGKGYLWISDDYASSVNNDDLLANARQLIAAKPGAHEVIWTLPNGLQGYLVTDGDGKRLDRAGIEFARDLRNGFASPEVEIRNCLICHNVGPIPIKDHVRLVTRKALALQVEQVRREDARLAQQIVDRFFATEIADEVTADQQSYAAVVQAATGLAPAAAGLALRKALLRYEADLSLEDLARETGYPVDALKATLERSRESNLDQSVLVTLTGEKGRRDQLESRGFGQLMQLLITVPQQKEK